MDVVFYWIGIGAVALAMIAVVFVAALFFWSRCIKGRFSAILFRKGERRLSIASWYAGKLLRTDGESRDDDWPADDWPIGERPFYLSFRIGECRLFLLAGMLSPRRSSSIKGIHP